MATLLILVQGYPSEADRYNMAYVHTRLLLYAQAGMRLQVLNFGTPRSYVYEGIEVLSEQAWRRRGRRADVLISHAPNLRNHLRFLRGPGRRIPRWILVFHGHEVLRRAAYYPAPYPYDRRNRLLWSGPDRIYDRGKLLVWRRLLPGWLAEGRLRLVFVSRWMKQAFLDCVGISPGLVDAHAAVIPNPVHPAFLASRYAPQTPYAADLVTIRPLDNPKYAVDEVRRLALAHPELRFDVYGRGRFFSHYPPPPNLRWFDRYLPPGEMTALLGRYRAALMPTRLDAQGVMACELASFDMPLLTTDLPVCREMLNGFSRVGFLDGRDLALQLTDVETKPPTRDRGRFAPEMTVARELELIEGLRRA